MKLYSRHIFIFFISCNDHRDLHSFPTRRSSDLQGRQQRADDQPAVEHRELVDQPELLQHRSEEHTSELQSRRDLVCRHPLEKKKFTSARITTPTPTTTK